MKSFMSWEVGGNSLEKHLADQRKEMNKARGKVKRRSSFTRAEERDLRRSYNPYKCGIQT